MDFRITPVTAVSLRRLRAANLQLPEDLPTGRAPTRGELTQVLHALEGFAVTAIPKQPASGKLWRIDLRSQPAETMGKGALTGLPEFATIVLARCPKADGVVNPVVIQYGTPIVSAKLAFALAAVTGPLLLEGGDLYGDHLIWDGRPMEDLFRDMAEALDNSIAEEEFNHQDELLEQLERLKSFASPRRAKVSAKPGKRTMQPALETTAVSEPIELDAGEWQRWRGKILEDPSNDRPRLAAADWLEKGGHRDRAEFIRAQIELDRMTIPHPCEKATRRHQPTCGSTTCKLCTASLLATSRSSELHARTAKLLAAGSNQRDWCGFSLAKRTWRIRYSRGFVDAVLELQVADFLMHAADIFGAEPVTSIGLVNIAPKQEIVGPAKGRPKIQEIWQRDSSPKVTRRTSQSNRLPTQLFDLLPGATGLELITFDATGEASVALNRACVALGRQLAGLPAWLPPPPSIV